MLKHTRAAPEAFAFGPLNTNSLVSYESGFRLTQSPAPRRKPAPPKTMRRP